MQSRGDDETTRWRDGTAMRRQGESRTGTKSEITGRNRNQSTRALADTDPSASTTPQNRLIPMNHAHYDNQPPSSHPPEAPKPRTKPENESLKPIWSTPAPAGRQPPTTHHTKNRRIPTAANNTTIKHRPAISPPTTQPPEPVDRIGEHTPKSDPVHTDTGRHPTINLCDTTKPLNSNNPHAQRQSTTAKPSARSTQTTDQTRERAPKTDLAHTGTGRHADTSQPPHQNRRIPTIRRQDQHQTQSTTLPVDPSRGLNRKPYYEIGTSPHEHRPTPDHQPRQHHKTARFQ